MAHSSSAFWGVTNQVTAAFCKGTLLPRFLLATTLHMSLFICRQHCCCFAELTGSAYSLMSSYTQFRMATLPSERKAATASHLPGISPSSLINIHQRALLMWQGLIKKLKAGIRNIFGITFCWLPFKTALKMHFLLQCSGTETPWFCQRVGKTRNKNEVHIQN